MDWDRVTLEDRRREPEEPAPERGLKSGLILKDGGSGGFADLDLEAAFGHFAQLAGLPGDADLNGMVVDEYGQWDFGPEVIGSYRDGS